ncbi:MAG: putative hotdog family 3-hydroxylacyl-ACP dehydratase [Gammaproteobacteria bacterium]|jgi:predicted hotdog family 3-hydroxylacyl-ACP dehydratase
MNTSYSVEDLVMHRGKMNLLDTIVDYGDDWLLAEVTIREDSMFADSRGVPAWIGLEYLAQTIGAFDGLKERLEGKKPKLGFLVGSRKYQCSRPYFAIGQTLSLHVQFEMQADNGLSVFSCLLTGDSVEATTSLNVFQPEDAEKFIQDSIA